MNTRRLPLSDIVNENRSLILLIVTLLLGIIFAPGFANLNNFKAILHGASLTAIIGIGFTIVMCVGHFDLSIGAILLLCGSIAIRLREQAGMSWFPCMLVAFSAGALIGLTNGLLVIKGKISSFIVTLGMMQIVLGVMQLNTGGVNVFITDFALSDALSTQLIPVVTTTSVICLFLVVLFSLFMTRTKYGRNMFIIGGNPQTAVTAGIRKDFYSILAFVFSGFLAAVGGVIFSIGMGTTTVQESLASTTFMRVLSATIIGGTLMSGGKGSIAKTYIAVLMLEVVFNVLGCLGLNYQVQLFVNGLIFGIVVLYDAYATLISNRLRGQKPNIAGEAIELKKRLFQSIRREDKEVT